MLTGWGHTTRSRATVVAVADPDQVVELVCSRPVRGVLARGLGRAYGDAAQNAGGLVLDLSALSGIGPVGADGCVRVAAGASLDALIRRVLPQGWFVPVTPGTRQVTVGGAIAADVHGKNQHRVGGFCDHVEQIELAAPAGQVAARPGEAAFLATCGGMGLTGVVTAATVRLARVESAFMAVETRRTRCLHDTLTALAQADAEPAHTVAWLDLTAAGRELGRGVIDAGEHARVGDLPPRLRRDPFGLRGSRALPSPPAPFGLIRHSTVRRFNAAWFRRGQSGCRVTGVGSFFHPLDAVSDWYRLYGRGGFVQYQPVIPFGSECTLAMIVERLAAARAPVALAVLKRFGRAAAGPLGFALPGWTLAVDLPARWPGLDTLLDGLDRLVAAAGGRVYLAKDARLQPELAAAMYPDLPRWRELRAQLDPHGVMRSDLARRLELAP